MVIGPLFLYAIAPQIHAATVPVIPVNRREMVSQSSCIFQNGFKKMNVSYFNVTLQSRAALMGGGGCEQVSPAGGKSHLLRLITLAMTTV